MSADPPPRDPGATPSAQPSAASLPDSPSRPNRVASGRTPVPRASQEMPRGATLGRYLILAKLGAGGMGVVYAAYDPELDRKVAIKLLHAAAGRGEGAQGRARLLREAQAMARLAHPNVVTVYDVGTIDERVFIAMEFVDGCTLTEWLTQAQRTQAEIREKFIAAGRGLLAAHAAGLVHRDFKPDNVLIGKDGRARVTDFGIARSIEQSPAAPGDDKASDELAVARRFVGPDGTTPSLNAPFTQQGALLGTPRYMSPEQFNSEPVDARTDQFSFCVALYEAVHGIEPFSGTTLAARCLSVITGQLRPVPPEAQRRVPGWLRKVLLRGLRTRPADRFPDMDALLAALGRDVVAQRRRIATGMLVLVLVACMGGLWVRGSRKHPGSQCLGAGGRLTGIWDAGRKQAVQKALFGSGRGYAQEAWQRLETRLDAYTRDWIAAQVDACQATYVRGVQSPAVLDLRMRCLDRRLQEVAALTGQIIEADENALEQAGGAGTDLTPLSSCADVTALSATVPLPETPQARAAVDALQDRLIAIRAAERVGQFSKVLPEARAAATEAAKIGYPPAQAEALILLAELQKQNSERAASEQSLFQAVAAAVRGRDHHRAARAWTLLMFTAGLQRDFVEAERRQELANAELDLTSTADDIRGQLYNNLCAIGLLKRTYAEALVACDKAIAYRRQYYGPEHSLVAAVISNKSAVYRGMGQFPQSLELAQQAYQMQTRVLGPTSPRLAESLNTLAMIYRAQENYRESDATYQKVIEIFESSFGQTHRRTSNAIFSLALSKLYQKQYPEAATLADRVLAIRSQVSGPESTDVASAHHLRGRIAFLQGRFAEAQPHFQQALEIYEKKHQADGIGLELFSIANCLSGLGKAKEALQFVDRAERLRNETSPADRAADLMFARARALWATGNRSKQNREAIRKLTDGARAAYTKIGQSARNDLELLTSWLREQKLP